MPDFTVYHGKLPHWRQDGGTYWVEWNLLPSVSPLIPKERTLIQSALRFFDEERYDLLGYVVMNDHVHLLVFPYMGYSLESILYGWKSFTANRLQRQFGRQNAVWQKESFDHIVRSEVEFEEKMLYLMTNPFKRWPEIESYPWLLPQP